MADETEDEVVVKIDADEPPKADVDDVRVTTDPDPAVAEAKAQYDKLSQERDAERTRAEAAERNAAEALRRAQTAQQEAHSARSEVADSQLGSVTSGLSAAESEATAAEQAYAAAMEAGNFVEAAKAQRRMARAEAESIRLNEAKSELEARKTRPQQDARPISSDPVENYIQNRTEPTQKWLREHRDWIVDPKKNARLTSAHFAAVADGLTPDTEAYFEAVEENIGLRKPETKGNGDASDGAVQVKAHTRRAPPVAPVAAGSSSTGGGSEVRLSKREAEAATDGTHVWNYNDPSGKNKFKKGDPIGVQEFARRKLALQKQGMYDKAYSEA